MEYNSKNIKKIKRKEELPSFLKDLTASPEDFITPPRPKSKQHLGPIFFGVNCEQFQPPLHKLSLGALRQYQKVSLHTSAQTVDDLFCYKGEAQKPCKKMKEFHPTIKPKKSFYDPYPHKCPGIRKAFVPVFKTPRIDLGKTTSIIEGETVMEVPFCRFRRASSDTSETELEFFLPSDLREEKWKYLSRKEQISHPHFPKHFVTVLMKGPNIPSALTITKLPCKRNREYDAIFLKKSEEKVMNNEMVTEQENEDEELDSQEMESEIWTDEQSSKSGFSAEESKKLFEMEENDEETDEELELEETSEIAYQVSETETNGREIFENEKGEEGEVPEETIEEGE